MFCVKWLIKVYCQGLQKQVGKSGLKKSSVVSSLRTVSSYCVKPALKTSKRQFVNRTQSLHPVRKSKTTKETNK